MSDPTRLTLTLAAASATAVAASQTPAGAGALVLSGGANNVAGPTVFQGVSYTNYAKMDVARRIIVSSTGSDASVVFTIQGFNRDTQPISETVTGVVSGTPVATKNDFLYVTSVSASGATAGAITVGTNTTASTPWILCHPYVTGWALSAAAAIVSGSVTYQFEHTYDDPNGGANINQSFYAGSGSGDVMPNAAIPPAVFASGTGGLTAATSEYFYGGGGPSAGTTTVPSGPCVAHRLTITAGTGVIAFYSLQTGLRS